MDTLQENNKVSFRNIFIIGGAYISYCIGSGFATGQDLIQYFGGFGIMGFVGLLIALILHGYTAVTFMRAGRKHEFQSNLEVFEYYSGPLLGRCFLVLSIGFTFLSPTVMIAGFGASLKQYMGIPEIAGNFLLAFLCIGTLLLGLKKLVDIIGVIAPVLIVIALLTGAVFLIMNFENIKTGLQVAPLAEHPRMGAFWLDAGISYAGWAPLVTAPFMAAAARTTLKNNREAFWGGIFAVVLYGMATTVMVASFFCDYTAISQNMVPTLYMAGQISQYLAIAFIVVIFLGIYSSAVPEFFTFCMAFFKDGSRNFKILTVISIVASTILTMLIPFDVFLNMVYRSYGYVGMFFIVLVMVKDVKTFTAGKNKDAA